MQAPLVAISRQETYAQDVIRDNVNQMLEGLNLSPELRSKAVLVKPNCTGAFSSESGRTTHPAVAAGVVLALRDLGCEVVIGESSTVGTDTAGCFKTTGIKHVADELDVRLVDFKESEYVEVPYNNGYRLTSIQLPAELKEVDYVISLAKLKTNFVTTISCAIKNMKGVLRDVDKREFHRVGLSESVADLYSVLRDNIKSIALVDGIVGSELYEPKKAGVLVGSASLLACDIVCAQLMGVSPEEVKHLQLARQTGVREFSSDHIEIIGDDNVSISSPFQSSLPGLKALAEKFEVEIIDGQPCSSCVGALYHCLKKIQATEPDLLKGVRIAVGDQSVNGDLLDLISFGNCALSKGSNLNTQGCPPRSEEFIKALKRRKP